MSTDDPKPRRALTLNDIAALAGVSRSAASRALDRKAPVKGPKADRVRQIAAEHGYVPNAWAANLRRQRTGLIGVVVSRLTDTPMAMIYEAVVEQAAARGYQAAVVSTDDDPRKALERGRLLLAQRVDGFVLTTARTDGADPFLLELQEQGVPYSLVMRTDGTGPAALTDDVAGGGLATRHLIEHGHRRIAYVGGPLYASSSQNREAGYRRAMEEAGLPVPPELVHHSDFSIDAGVDVGRRLLALADVPTAVFTANDSLAIGVMFAAQRAGVDVPGRLSIVGYTDTPIAARLSVPLTSVNVPFDALAADALDLLLADGGDRPAAPRLSDPSLVVRDSVAAPHR
ncbi:LacI family DNA-binding transcriptional regulator [Glycomyces terrestris]|uniref:LacI family transcriptional regulator n=1 Tax=Glycomyces terrestris TaxID=2493553 RepID=A0A426V328_9ACTN|nr:LacI family DNA-binding transcriptional regulator [Glycomyces terrestris]RRS01255.1 LacI family transcriptional regulator [Glycomyces terrestris]